MGGLAVPQRGRRFTAARARDCLEEAVRRYERVLQAWPDLPDAVHMLGVARLQQHGAVLVTGRDLLGKPVRLGGIASPHTRTEAEREGSVVLHPEVRTRPVALRPER